jgi:hypothetical protein
MWLSAAGPVRFSAPAAAHPRMRAVTATGTLLDITGIPDADIRIFSLSGALLHRSPTEPVSDSATSGIRTRYRKIYPMSSS